MYQKRSDHVSEKVEPRITERPSISLLGIYPKELKVGIQTNICTSVFIPELFTIAKGRNNPSVPGMNE